jgi:hypothetical protein
MDNALVIADILAGRQVDTGTTARTPEADEAYAMARAYFAEIGVEDHATYLAHREDVKAALRRLAVEIRSAKAGIRVLDGNSGRYWTMRCEIADLRERFASAHDLRRLGKAWSPMARSLYKSAQAA